MREDKQKRTEKGKEIAQDKEVEPDWDHECEVCGQRPILPVSGMCGPCTFGDAETAGGDW